jgi:poly-gamma-glutamate synthesis protein (capsule biosynthesis protein)
MILKYDSFTKKPFRMGIFGDMGCESMQIGTIVNSDPFMYIRKWMNTLDFTMGQLETTFSGYESDYPKFSSSDIFANFLKGKFDLLCTANNHSLDGGVNGALRTNKILDEIGIPHIGTGTPERPRKSYDVKLNGFDITFLNYVTSINGEKSEKEGGIFQDVDPQEIPTGIINFYDEAEIKEKIDIAKTRSEFIIPTIHQRHSSKIREYGKYASEKQIEDLEPILDMGANIVIGAHPHDFQGGRLYSEDRIIVYSLGNFFSSMTNEKYPVNSGCVMVISVDSYQNTQYTFLPVCTYQTQGLYYVLPMAPIEMGAYKFIKNEDRTMIIHKLQEIREVLSRCDLAEEMVQPQYL